MAEDSYQLRRDRIAGMIRPDTVLVPPGEVEEARRIIFGDTSTSSTGPTISRERAQQIADGCIHPQTHSIIPTPLRLSWILPSNVIMNTIMVMAANSGSYAAIGASQWLNQTYNVSHYYANRNASNSSSDADLALAYVGATSSSVFGAAMIEKFARASKYSHQLRVIAPFTAVSLATFFNMTLMRKSEVIEGVVVKDEYGTPMGKSVKAGQIGVGTSIAGRIITAMLPMTIPTMVSNKANATILKKFPKIQVPFYMATLCVVIQVTTPWTLGLFKQHTSMPVSYLEPEFQNFRMKDGKVSKEAYWNRGM